jgi:hypothetical protein
MAAEMSAGVVSSTVTAAMVVETATLHSLQTYIPTTVISQASSSTSSSRIINVPATAATSKGKTSTIAATTTAKSGDTTFLQRNWWIVLSPLMGFGFFMIL